MDLTGEPGAEPRKPALALAPDEQVLQSWMEANGIVEWLPEPLRANIQDGELTYLSYLWRNARGFDSRDILVDSDGSTSVEWRTVPLRVDASPQVVDAFAATGHILSRLPKQELDPGCERCGRTAGLRGTRGYSRRRYTLSNAAPEYHGCL